jgi:hypothetical protein
MLRALPQRPGRSPGAQRRTAPGTKVFLLLFLQKKKTLPTYRVHGWRCWIMTEETETKPEPAAAKPERQPMPKEIGGPKGKEPTRYGDWEVKGRCSDF